MCVVEDDVNFVGASPNFLRVAISTSGVGSPSRGSRRHRMSERPTCVLARDRTTAPEAAVIVCTPTHRILGTRHRRRYGDVDDIGNDVSSYAKPPECGPMHRAMVPHKLRTPRLGDSKPSHFYSVAGECEAVSQIARLETSHHGSCSIS
jgi:hypothetical protein